MTSYRVRVPGWQQLLREWEHECATLAQEIPPLEIEVARLRKLVDQEADEFLDFYIPATTRTMSHDEIKLTIARQPIARGSPAARLDCGWEKSSEQARTDRSLAVVRAARAVSVTTLGQGRAVRYRTAEQWEVAGNRALRSGYYLSEPRCGAPTRRQATAKMASTTRSTRAARWISRLTTPANWNSLLIGGALSDPMLRGSYPSDFFLRCDDLQIQRLTPYLFRTTAGYLGKQGNPLDQPPQIYWGSTVTEEEIDVDMDGNPIIMVTGEGFDPPVREPVYDRILRITRNIADYNDNWATLFRNATNANQFGSFPPGTALCRSLDAEHG